MENKQHYEGRPTLAEVQVNLSKECLANLLGDVQGLVFEGEKRMPDGLCFVEENEGKFQVLRRMLIEGEQSGRAGYSYETFLAEFDSSAGIRHREVS